MMNKHNFTNDVVGAGIRYFWRGEDFKLHHFVRERIKRTTKQSLGSTDYVDENRLCRRSP